MAFELGFGFGLKTVAEQEGIGMMPGVIRRDGAGLQHFDEGFCLFIEPTAMVLLTQKDLGKTDCIRFNEPVAVTLDIIPSRDCV